MIVRPFAPELPVASSCTTASASAATPIPFKRDAEAVGGSMAAGSIGILIVSLLAIVAVLVVRKRLKLGAPTGGAAPLVKVIESQRLGARALLTVVEFGGAQHLIAQSEQGVTYLVAGPASAPPQEPV